MALTVQERNSLQAALEDAYDPDRMKGVLDTIDRKWNNLVGLGSTFPVAISQIIMAAQQQGWIPDLVKAAYGASGNNPLMTAFHDAYVAQRPESTDPEAPFKALILRANRLFIDREPLRKALRNLASPNGSSVLVVDGPAACGKTHSAYLIQHLAESSQHDFRVHRFHLDEPAGRNPDELALDIVYEIAGDKAGAMPAQGPGTVDRWVPKLATWVSSEIEKLGTLRWLIFDGFNKATVPSTTIDFLTQLTLKADGDQHRWIRVVLLSYKQPVHPDLVDVVQREDITPFGKGDMVAMVMNVATARRKNVKQEDVIAGVESIWQAYPEGTKDRFRELARELARMLEPLLA